MSPLATDTDIVRTKVARSDYSGYPQFIKQVYSVQFNLDLQENTAMGTIVQAEILLFQESQMLLQSDPHLHVEIKVVTDGPSPAVSIKHVGIEEPGYTTFDITAILKPWFTNNLKGPLALEVSAYCMDSHDENVFVDGLRDKRPKLIISKELEDDSSQQRLKRQSTGPGVGFCQANMTTCCLHPLTINFREDLGFDFILQPREFAANFCEGLCPDVSGSGSHVTPGLYYFLNRLDSSLVEPCCVTHTTQSIEVLYKLKGVLVIDELQSVTVTSCRCG